MQIQVANFLYQFISICQCDLLSTWIILKLLMALCLFNYDSEKILPIDFLLSVYDSLFISLQAGQMDFILKTKSWLILNVENESFFLNFLLLFN